MRVLLADDNLRTSQNLFRALKQAHYTVDWIRDTSSAALAVRSTSYVAVLLDLDLPGVSGLEFLKSLRANGNCVPVLSFTTQEDIETRVVSLDVGADDCLLKPIDARELCARLRAVLRRRAGFATSRIGDDSLALDLERRTLHRSGASASLSAREFALMHTLLERPGAIFSRRQLEDRIYGWGREVESNAVDVLIHSMRKRFGQSLIRNVRGMGWMVATPGESEAA